jgi:deoxycytidylate deaminase
MAQSQPIPQGQAAELLPTGDEKDLLLQIRSTHTHEIVIGLCGSVGAPTEAVSNRLKALLEGHYSYQSYVTKLSTYIEKYAESPINKTSIYSRYYTLISEGNRIKGTYGNSVLAELAIAEISIRRDQKLKVSGGSEFQPERFCHIIDSIKNQDELNAFKAVYGDLFICIGVYSSPEAREERLKQRGMTQVEFDDLVDRESGEEKKPGQSVRKTFPSADFFLDCGSYAVEEIDKKLTRVLELILGSKIITPMKGETAMYMAYTASLNSACLSRQVGAAVTDQNGYLLGIGWNDVPRYGGSVYNQAHQPDNRCHAFGSKCYNDDEKQVIAENIVKDLTGKGFLADQNTAAAIKVIKEGRIGYLIEFSRAVHAEMLALLNAGRSGGERMQCGKIYVTTYPCHVCARHIIASGIYEIYYIEPYRKSLATRLHSDAITESTRPEEAGKVRLIPFEGVSPTRYADFFRMGNTDRKSNGLLVKRDPHSLNFKAETSLRSIPALEGVVVKKLSKQHLLPSS